MAINRTDTVEFLFENSNGRLYNVRINKATGVGVGRLLPQVDSANVYDDMTYDNTEVAITVDAGSLAAWKNYHKSRMCYAAVYNTTTALNGILNAA